MARLEGFEPPTNGFGSRYSIRLSYRRVAWNRTRRAARDGHSSRNRRPPGRRGVKHAQAGTLVGAAGRGVVLFR